MVFAGTGVWKSKRGTPLLGCRRVFINDEQYGYNVRDELISADEVSYAHDDIGLHAPTSVSEVGNRTTAEGKTYTANNLNQYTAIDDFAPQYDDDGIHAPTSMSEVGNQSLIKTETGIWSVTYNAENRPIRWQSGDTVITMAFDRMGRRVEMRTMKDGAETLQRFVYDNYLCIQQLRGADNALFHSYIWDPTEPIATRPLVFLPASGEIAYYFHDGNKNVADLIYHTRSNGLAAHYDYAPFGAITHTSSSTTQTRPILTENPFRFSSEVHDNSLGLVYYNFRHYAPIVGRWYALDTIESSNQYLFALNSPTMLFDRYGLFVEPSFPKSIKPQIVPDLKASDGTSPRALFKINLEIACSCSNDMGTGNVKMDCTMSINPQILLAKPNVLDDETRAELNKNAQHELNHYKVWLRNYYENMKAYVLSREKDPPCEDCDNYARETEQHVKLMQQALSDWENAQEYGGFRQEPWVDYGRNPPLLQNEVDDIIKKYLQSR